MTSELDRIERQITIDAPATRVWELVAEPGWYINEKQLTEHRLERDGDLTVVHDPVHGAFTFRTVALDEPNYAAFRWLSDHTDPDSPSTLVEFRLDAVSDTSTVLSVTETGFDSLPGDSAERRAQYEGNVEGWAIELDLAKAHLEKGKTVAAH
ncbi:SRPBCC domain-containing protein [Rhodococcus artemisiae]|uniref:ATPase n=1 Tax=Rhodococcus artemisiae TaxID=714159 RepID=A0ABU7LBK2_9NOCA|nr:SRPBCC domain-containing protein [Rhodococcus artemisiae]MEE2058687.1 ATPase [Rhodococcus artemisiae]